MFTVRSLEHVAIAYRDTDAAAKWYCDVLGFEIVFQALNPQHGVNFYFVRDPAGTGLIEIIPMPKGDGTMLHDIRTSHVHIAFDVDDMDAAVAALQARGVQLEGPPAKMGENRLVFFRDPEGAPLQLVQRAKALRISK
jgi:catechol 2,3-dioxygenase-like lactoylglutathione lyase family enzyme